MLDTDLLAHLMSGKRRKKETKPSSKGYALVRTSEGIERENLTTGITDLVGSYQGNVGSTRRSKKGRTTRLPNGRRYYVHGEGSDVVAYLAKVS